MVLKPSSGFIALVFGVIVLLEDDAGGILVMEGKAFLKFILHDLGVELPIYLPINLASIPNSLPQHTAPHHQGSTPIFESPAPTCHLGPPLPSSTPISSHL